MSRREFNEHIDKHKEEAIKQVKKHLRSILILNKHGILLDEVRLGYRIRESGLDCGLYS